MIFFEILAGFALIVCFAVMAIWMIAWVPPQFRRAVERDRSARTRRAVRRYEEAHPAEQQSFTRPRGTPQFDISPGETRKRDGTRDLVLEASMQSFPASDPPAY